MLLPRYPHRKVQWLYVLLFSMPRLARLVQQCTQVARPTTTAAGAHDDVTATTLGRVVEPLDSPYLTPPPTPTPPPNLTSTMTATTTLYIYLILYFHGTRKHGAYIYYILYTHCIFVISHLHLHIAHRFTKIIYFFN